MEHMEQTPNRLVIRRPDDMHVHLRDGDMLRAVAPHTARDFARALVMPNLRQPVTTGRLAAEYEDAILHATDKPGLHFNPLMTIKLTQETWGGTIAEAAKHGVKAVKLYPEGVTTNSEEGVRDLDKIDPGTFRAMVHAGMVLCVHAEEPGVFSMEREQRYLTRIERLATTHWDLKIVVEHITTREAVRLVRSLGPNVAATITAHHLVLTLDDVIGDKIKVHNFCKPIAKSVEDRDALIGAALSGDTKFFFGSDSAPHEKSTKECESGCAGCFTAPVAMELLATIFEGHGSLGKLEAFTSEHGARFYGLPLNEGTVTLEKADPTLTHRVPLVYGLFPEGISIVPFKAGEKLGWKMMNSSPEDA